jgi:putative redox protein
MPTEVHALVSQIEYNHFHGENLKGIGIEMDSQPAGEPVAGPSPMEVILQAAGACSLMDVALILRKRRTPAERLEAKVTGIKRDQHPKIYQKIEIVYRAKGEGITIEELDKAAKLSLDVYCSVFGMLKQIAEVSYRCELIS